MFRKAAVKKYLPAAYELSHVYSEGYKREYSGTESDVLVLPNKEKALDFQ